MTLYLPVLCLKLGNAVPLSNVPSAAVEKLVKQEPVEFVMAVPLPGLPVPVNEVKSIV